MSHPMVTDPRFDPEPTYTEAPPREKKGCSSCLMGCGIVAIVLFVLLVIAGLVFWRYGKGWIASGTAKVLSMTVEASALPLEEKQEMKVQVDRVTEAFRDGRLSWERLGPLIEQIVESPVMTTLFVSVVEKQYLDKSGLSDEEKAKGRQTLGRFCRGLIDEKIKEPELDAVMVHIADRGPGGGWQIKQQLSDEDLRKSLATAKEAADKAEIPDEPETVDPSEELKRMIDAALDEP